MALLQEKTAPDSTTKPPIHEISARYPRTCPQFRAFSVAARGEEHGRIPLRLGVAAESGRRNRFSRAHPPAFERIPTPRIPLEIIRKCIGKPREFIEFYPILRELLFALFWLCASPEQPSDSRPPRLVRRRKKPKADGRLSAHAPPPPETRSRKCGITPGLCERIDRARKAGSSQLKKEGKLRPKRFAGERPGVRTTPPGRGTHSSENAHTSPRQKWG